MGRPWLGCVFFLDTIEDKVKRVKGKAKSVCYSQNVLVAWEFFASCEHACQGALCSAPQGMFSVAQ